MSTASDARGNQILENILKALNKQTDLLAAQNKILDKMEKHARPSVVTQPHPYLERQDGEHRPGPNHQEGDGGPAGGVQGTIQGGATSPSGSGLGGGSSGR